MGILFYNANGKNGADGAPGADGLGFTWRGEWNQMYSYAINDVVSYLNNLYIYVGGMVLEFPPQPPPNSSRWQLFLPGVTSDFASYTLNFPSKNLTVSSIIDNNGSLTITVLNPTSYQKGYSYDTLYCTAKNFQCNGVVKTVYSNRIEFLCEDGNWSGSAPESGDIIYDLWTQSHPDLLVTHSLNTNNIVIVLFADTTGSGYHTRRFNEESTIYQNNQDYSNSFGIPMSFYSAQIFIFKSTSTNQFTGTYTEIPEGPGGGGLGEGGIIPIG
jgi:hypothetical protein